MLKDSGLRDATHSVLRHESQLFIAAYNKNPSAPLPNSYSLKGFIGQESLPDTITIIRNTMDLIDYKNCASENRELERLLQRIRRASDTIKAVTEAILDFS